MCFKVVHLIIEGGIRLMQSRSRSRRYLIIRKMLTRRTSRMTSFSTGSSTSRLQSTGLVWITASQTTPILIITTICTTITVIVILAHVLQKKIPVFFFPFYSSLLLWSPQIKLQIILNNRIFLWINPFFVFHLLPRHNHTKDQFLFCVDSSELFNTFNSHFL